MLDARLVPCISCGQLISNQANKCPKCESNQIIETYSCIICKSKEKVPSQKFYVCSIEKKANVSSIVVCKNCFNSLVKKQKEHYSFLSQKTIEIQCNLCKNTKKLSENIVFYSSNSAFLNNYNFSYNDLSFYYIEEPKYSSNDFNKDQKLLRRDDFRDCKNCGNPIGKHAIERFLQEFHYKKPPYISTHDNGGRSSKYTNRNNHMCWVCGMGFSISKSKPVVGSIYFGKAESGIDITTGAFFHQDCLEIIDPFWIKKVEEDKIQKKLKKDELEQKIMKMERMLNKRQSSEATAKTIKNIVPWITSVVFAILAWIDWGFAGVIPVFIISYLLGLWIGHILYEKHSDATSDAFLKQKIDGEFITSLRLEKTKKELESMRSLIEEIDSEKFPYIGRLNIYLD